MTVAGTSSPAASPPGGGGGWWLNRAQRAALARAEQSLRELCANFRMHVADLNKSTAQREKEIVALTGSIDADDKDITRRARELRLERKTLTAEFQSWLNPKSRVNKAVLGALLLVLGLMAGVVVAYVVNRIEPWGSADDMYFDDHIQVWHMEILGMVAVVTVGLVLMMMRWRWMQWIAVLLALIALPQVLGVLFGPVVSEFMLTIMVPFVYQPLASMLVDLPPPYAVCAFSILLVYFLMRWRDAGARWVLVSWLIHPLHYFMRWREHGKIAAKEQSIARAQSRLESDRYRLESLESSQSKAMLRPRQVYDYGCHRVITMARWEVMSKNDGPWEEWRTTYLNLEIERLSNLWRDCDQNFPSPN